jgi:hypothetical protein
LEDKTGFFLKEPGGLKPVFFTPGQGLDGVPVLVINESVDVFFREIGQGMPFLLFS